MTIHACISGRVVADAELRQDNIGGPYASFRVSSQRKEHGQRVDDIVNCSIFGPRATRFAPQLTRHTNFNLIGTLETFKHTSGDMLLRCRVLHIDILDQDHAAFNVEDRDDG